MWLLLASSSAGTLYELAWLAACHDRILVHHVTALVLSRARYIAQNITSA